MSICTNAPTKILSNKMLWLLIIAVVTLFFGVIDPAHAADATPGGGAGLPWEGPLQKLSQSISGPVAFVIALLEIGRAHV